MRKSLAFECWAACPFSSGSAVVGWFGRFQKAEPPSACSATRMQSRSMSLSSGSKEHGSPVDTGDGKVLGRTGAE